MSRAAARVARAEQLIAQRTARTPGADELAALLDGVLAKAERALAGDIGAPADWTNVRAEIVAHRWRLLQWVLKQD